ncbi:hypothetical protein JR316_0010577 [Psilocybe cubensis]|uniref:DUF8191 domain-containing protein n=3 Tax=Psilocybe cubensis TaxID=181762 RepID=A0A8H7XLV9_PSICU|nr:hypothetical protein JR316_0010449 [Psilocybe cubensis]XP_047744288.1 hypothetical protein JR316_0010577 [Psilocybe cubensis]KAH9476537.1 hypothetical protein JR316_0010449 [Psilocybe cubensis]KAH9476663.1 hypothetical protein JR316_0010577 [Psilocybe cubensis]
MAQKLQRKKIEIKSLKKALKIVSNGSESDQDSTEDDLDTEDSDDKGDDEESDDEGDDSDDDDGEDLPIPTQSYECKDIYLCSDQACGGEVTDGYCFLCRKKHQIMEDENMASTESQLEHPDRCMAPRGNTPLQSIPKDDSPLPALYESRAREYRSLLRRGATPEMCELFKLEFTYTNGIVARVTEDLFEEFAGLSMVECDWKIYLGRRLTLAKDDIDGYEFIESILDEISVLPGIGNWVTEEEETGVWVTYPKHSGQVESQPRDILDSVDIAAENRGGQSGRFGGDSATRFRDDSGHQKRGKTLNRLRT